MQGGTVVFLAGCAFVAFGLPAMQSVASALWRGRAGFTAAPTAS